MSLRSPLRYPGGKARLAPWLAWSLHRNGLHGPVFIEAYAGGAGASIYLLANHYVSRIEINDIDPAVAAFWRSAVYRSGDFAERIGRIPVTLEERGRQKEVLKSPERHSDFDLGFAAWYLNRVNYSGIIRGGPIGGRRQSGAFRLDARFNRPSLMRNILALGELSSRICVHQRDALDLLGKVVPEGGGDVCVFLDPPYFHKSGGLYENGLDREDHRAVSETVRALGSPWIMTYDNCAEIAALYRGMAYYEFSVTTHAGMHRGASAEILIYGNLSLPCPPCLLRTTGPIPDGNPRRW